MEKTTLYSKDAKGAIRVWSIGYSGNTLFMESGTYGGESNVSTEVVPCGLAGRTLMQQIQMRINSRVNKKIDAGYVRSYEDALNNIKTNSLGFLKQMKCERYDIVMNKIPWNGIYVQRKLDGHHCTVVNDKGKLIAYSSNGKIIDTIDHILDQIDIPEGTYIDGELYIHGVPLQTISSYVKKKQDDTLNLHYYVYDLISSECYTERYKKIKSFKLGANASVLETVYLFGKFDVQEIVGKYLHEKYEGAILRLTGFPYESGKRSKGVIKCKPMHFDEFIIDDEFLVIDIGQSKDGWAVLYCETETGAKFKAACHGDMEYKKYVYENKNDFIGKHIRCEYMGLTKDKKPFQPVAREWREKADE